MDIKKRQEEASQELARQKKEAAATSYSKLYPGDTVATFLKEIQVKAKTGDAEAQHELACMYLNGDGVVRNPEMAVELFKLAVSQRHPLSEYRLGTCYTHGHGVELNPKKGFEYLKMAASQGIAPAKEVIRQHYTGGAAEGGAEEQYALGMKYFHGAVRFRRDLDKAREQFERSAAQRHPDAQYQLGKECLFSIIKRRNPNPVEINITLTLVNSALTLTLRLHVFQRCGCP